MFEFFRWLYGKREPKLEVSRAYGRTHVGPFEIVSRPSGVFNKDWHSDANMVWLIGEYAILYYGVDCTSEVIDPEAGQ